ncbi:HK97 family phage prohead protease [uncultured Thermomonospora sp.]|uniref:HK97 family phage prohead protease n=1 Tax=uncultured Thermomonospora sp. TaxID=671175 RepID=UPI00259B2566|nr:HK97 family phage prohead protease [uncultured Thermomonospora sp.]
MRPPRFCYRAFEFRAEDGGSNGRILEGYAAVFDTPTRIDSWEGEFDEQIARGAFKRTLNARTPVLQFDHGQDVRTGSVPIGAIQEIYEDRRGLFVRAELFDNDVVLPIRQAIAAGAIDGMSFRFRVVDDRWTRQENGPDLRTIREVELFELGPVVFPAYEQTSVGVRSLLAHLDRGDRAALIRELAAELRALDADEPARQGTSEGPTEPGQAATSGLSTDQRAAVLRGLDLLEIA